MSTLETQYKNYLKEENSEPLTFDEWKNQIPILSSLPKLNMYVYKALVKEVYDGDTITAIVDLGFRNQTTIKFRLTGINTPELSKATREEGLKSRDRLRELILGKEVIIKTQGKE